MTTERVAVPLMEPLQAVVVSTKTGLDIRGVLRQRGLDGLVLAGAAIAGEQNGKTVWKALPGDVVIPMGNIDYWQQALPPELVAMLELGGQS